LSAASAALWVLAAARADGAARRRALGAWRARGVGSSATEANGVARALQRRVMRAMRRARADTDDCAACMARVAAAWRRRAASHALFGWWRAPTQLALPSAAVARAALVARRWRCACRARWRRVVTVTRPLSAARERQ